MTYIDVIFYLVCLSQIFLLSFHYPNKMVKRVHYILDNYPVKDYPKLYPIDVYVNPDEITRKRINIFKYMNYFVSLVGLTILIAAFANGFTLDDKGSSAMLVALYLMLQAIPHGLIEYYQSKHYKHIREMNRATKRKANLKARKLSDFVSLNYIFLAIGLFVIHNILFIYYEGAVNEWDDGTWITLIVGALVNAGFAFMIFRFVSGWKLDPLQTDADKYNIIEYNIKTYVTSSILMSIFFITINTIREYNFDVWEPILMSVYFQSLIIFGLGFVLRNVKVEELNFEVYRADALETAI